LTDALCPKYNKRGAVADFGVHVLLTQKSLKKSNGAHVVKNRSRTQQHGTKAGGFLSLYFFPRIFVSFFFAVNSALTPD